MTKDTIQAEARALLRGLRVEAAEMSLRFRDLKAWSQRLDVLNAEIQAEAQRLGVKAKHGTHLVAIPFPLPQGYDEQVARLISLTRGVTLDGERLCAELQKWDDDDAALRARFFANLARLRGECDLASVDFAEVERVTEGSLPC